MFLDWKFEPNFQIVCRNTIPNKWRRLSSLFTQNSKMSTFEMSHTIKEFYRFWTIGVLKSTHLKMSSEASLFESNTFIFWDLLCRYSRKDNLMTSKNIFCKVTTLATQMYNIKYDLSLSHSWNLDLWNKTSNCFCLMRMEFWKLKMVKKLAYSIKSIDYSLLFDWKTTPDL